MGRAPDQARQVAQHRDDRAGRCGVRAVGLLWLGHRDAGAGQPRGRRPALCQLPRDTAVFPHPCVPADGSEPPRRRGRSRGGNDERVSQHPRLRRSGGGQPGRDSAPARLSDPCRREMASGSDRRCEPGGTLRPLAAATRVRSFLRLPLGRDQPMEPGTRPRQRTYRTAPLGRLPPVGGHRGSVLQMASAASIGCAGKALFPLRRLRGRTFAAPRAPSVRGQVPGVLR